MPSFYAADYGEVGSGVLVNVSSIAGKRYIGKPQVAYVATKAAVI